MSTTKWSKPTDVPNDPFLDIKGLLPTEAEIPDEFWKFGSSNVWVRWQSDWFYRGLQSLPTPNPGIDVNVAMRHLAAIQRSWDPRHEHKSAAVAWLASLWFEKPGSSA